MARIAVSGHRGLKAQTIQLIDHIIREELSGCGGEITGLSCLADGADQVFARAVLDLGGALEAVIPAEEYRAGLPTDVCSVYDELLSRAIMVHRMPYTEATSEAYMAASMFMVDRADELCAVWDGKPARGYGGTADVVGYARDNHRMVLVIWPDGARRD